MKKYFLRFGFLLLIIMGLGLEYGFALKREGTTVSGNQKLAPNEMGRIMILEYHLIGEPEGEWRRTPENFRHDLEMLYENGYYPVALNDLVSGNLQVPIGKTPFVLTFDDSSPGQFRLLKQGDQLIVDPQSAVGIMENFKKKRPDFPLTATFYVLPAIEPELRLFGQEDYIRRKLEFLVNNGYDIGNHSYWHQNLGKVNGVELQKQLALAVKAIQLYLPDYQVNSLALPFGVHARNRALEISGEYEGIKYHHSAILLVGSGPTPSPYSSDFNPYRLERIQAGDSPWGPGAYIKKFKNLMIARFVSDGNPKTIFVRPELETKLAKRFFKWRKISRLTFNKAKSTVEK